MNLTRFTMWGIANHSKLIWEPPCENATRPIDSAPAPECRLTPRQRHCRNANTLHVDFYDRYQECVRDCREEKCAHQGAGCEELWSFEALTVAAADEIAQRHHDIEDALIGNVLTRPDVVERLEGNFKNVWSRAEERRFEQLAKSVQTDYFLPRVSKFVVALLEAHLVENVAEVFKARGPRSGREFWEAYNHEITAKSAKKQFDWDTTFAEAHKRLQHGLKRDVLGSFPVQRMDGSASHVIRKLFKSYFNNPQQLPNNTVFEVLRAYCKAVNEAPPDGYRPDVRARVKDLMTERDHEHFVEVLARTIANHIACMTDDYALKEYGLLYGHLPPEDHIRAFAGPSAPVATGGCGLHRSRPSAV